jgi:hypothetical protein
MKTSALLFFFLTMLFVISLFETPYAVADTQPYAGQHQRSIKALSKKDIQGYKSGAGLGMAKAAELNHYPGPIHVLEFAAPLKLNKKQTKAIEILYQQMKADAIPLGIEIVALEARLDQLFATKTIQNKELIKFVSMIAEHKGRLRAVHLSVHLKTKPLLTPKQLAHYDQLRGYGIGSSSHENNKHGKHGNH